MPFASRHPRLRASTTPAPDLHHHLLPHPTNLEVIAVKLGTDRCQALRGQHEVSVPQESLAPPRPLHHPHHCLAFTKRRHCHFAATRVQLGVVVKVAVN